MPNDRRQRRDEVFLVRLWSEGSPPEGKRSWRASVTHVVSQERLYFADYGELLAFLERWKS